MTARPSRPSVSQLGRYQILGELGTGGMAEVFLARAAGPAGFEKFVALKRIHPHMAKEERFVQMFLDEARIAALVEHQNVAQVFDLGEADGTYFLAMEYLHGEHLGVVASRARDAWGHVPFALSAAIVAEAAAGLHAAHEAKDRRGSPLHLVHRDVSPQNIFITFDGRVKLTDFGIAKAADRVSHTKTGSIKGKIPYMSPEQVSSLPVDRRADVFSLGVVLWEISTGKRLFKADSDAQTIMRITGGRIAPPSEVFASYPPELDRIVMRALSRDVDQRYQTALELREDLLTYLSNSQSSVSDDELSSLMAHLVDDKRSQRDALLRSGSSNELVSDDEEPTLPEGRETSDIRVVAKPVRYWLWGIALLAVVLAGAAAMFWPRTQPTVEPVPTASAPLPGAVRIETVPAGAAIAVDGTALSDRSPLRVADLQPGAHRIEVRLDGHEDMVTDLEIFAGETTRVQYMLRAVAITPPPLADASVTAPAPNRRRRTELSAESQPDETPTAPPAGHASIQLRSLPWSKVRINGGAWASTPASLRVESGVVLIEYQVGGEGSIRQHRLRVDPGEEATVNLQTR